MSTAHRPWLSAYDPEVPANLDYEDIPLHEILDRSAATWPKRRAVIFHNWKADYAELKALTEHMAEGLRRQGLNKGDRVAIMLPNLPQTIIAFWAVLRAGGVGVMTNPLYMETEIVHQFNNAGIRICITLDLLWPKLEKLRHELPVEKFIVTKVSDGLKFPLNLLQRVKTRKESPKIPFDGKSVLPFSSVLDTKERFTAKGLSGKDTALLQYTGGTTGVAKGCVLSHSNLLANVSQCKAILHALGKEQEVFLGVLPFFHIYGLTTCLTLPTLVGATMTPFPRYVPHEVLEGIQKHRVTVAPGAPALYISLLQQKHVDTYDLTSINYFVSGSAPLPVEHIEQFQKRTGAIITEGYGLTEASPVTHLNPLLGTKKPGSIGLPFPDTDAKIVDMVVGGDSLPPGKLGELVVKGPQVMQGYYNHPSATADVLRNGWLYTGDIAYMDEEGYFFVVDRKKDLIISAGYNVYPREIDEVLYAHPQIREAVTVGIPHEARGEIVKAFVILEDDANLSRSDIIAYCREKLAAYKVPRQVEFRKELPKTMVGKVLRRALRDEEIAKQKQQKRS